MENRLKAKRIGMGLTQRQLADMAHVSWRTVQVWESLGTYRANAGALKRVADVMGCSVDDLIDCDGES